MEAKDFQALVEQLGELTAGERDALVEVIELVRDEHQALQSDAAAADNQRLSRRQPIDTCVRARIRFATCTLQHRTAEVGHTETWNGQVTTSALCRQADT